MGVSPLFREGCGDLDSKIERKVQQVKAWRRANPDKVMAQKQRYRRVQREQVNTGHKRYRRTHAKKSREYNQRYRQTQPKACRYYGTRRQQRLVTQYKPLCVMLTKHPRIEAAAQRLKPQTRQAPTPKPRTQRRVRCSREEVLASRCRYYQQHRRAARRRVRSARRHHQPGAKRTVRAAQRTQHMQELVDNVASWVPDADHQLERFAASLEREVIVDCPVDNATMDEFER